MRCRGVGLRRLVQTTGPSRDFHDQPNRQDGRPIIIFLGLNCRKILTVTPSIKAVEICFRLN